MMPVMCFTHYAGYRSSFTPKAKSSSSFWDLLKAFKNIVNHEIGCSNRWGSAKSLTTARNYSFNLIADEEESVNALDSGERG
jgi:hypothetical protein